MQCLLPGQMQRAALDVGHAAHTHTCSLGELLLREPGLLPHAAKQRGDCLLAPNHLAPPVFHDPTRGRCDMLPIILPTFCSYRKRNTVEWRYSTVVERGCSCSRMRIRSPPRTGTLASDRFMPLRTSGGGPR